MSNLYEMSNLTQDETNIPVVIWVSVKGKAKHGPRIKVSQDLTAENLTPVTIEDTPRFLFLKKKHKYENQIKAWISINKDALLQYWNSEISTATLLKKIKPLPAKGEKMKLKEDKEQTVKDEIFAMLSKNEKDEETLAELKKELEDSFEDQDEQFTFTFDGDDYRGFYDEDDAEQAAIKEVEDLIDSEPEIMSKDFLQDFMYVGPVDIRIMSGEEAEARLDGMDDEDIIKEAGKEDEYEAADDDQKEKILRDAKDELIDQYSTEIAEQLEKDPVGYFDDIGGQEMVDHMIKSGFLNIDSREAAKSAVKLDGWAHTISRYDGNYEETNSGAVFFRVD